MRKTVAYIVVKRKRTVFISPLDLQQNSIMVNIGTKEFHLNNLSDGDGSNICGLFFFDIPLLCSNIVASQSTVFSWPFYILKEPDYNSHLFFFQTDSIATKNQNLGNASKFVHCSSFYRLVKRYTINVQCSGFF